MKLATLLATVFLLGSFAVAQDPVKVDSKHYKVETENAQVRVLRVKYGPHEKSPMHQHPDLVAVFLTDAHVKFVLPDGKTEDRTVKAGEAMFTPAGSHAPENLGDKPFEGVLVELKGHSAAASAAKPAAAKSEPKPKK